MIPGPQEYAAPTPAVTAHAGALQARVKVWDLPVRLTHWLMALAFVGAYVTNRLGVAYFKYHEWFGYSLIVLVVFRILWGLWGTYHARFTNFLRSPAATWRYSAELLRRRDQPFPGHNPLGALMVVVLLLTLLVQAVTGLFANDEIFNAGALYGYVSNDTSLALTGLHKSLFYWIAAAVAVHILAVLFHTFIKRENLISAMFTGYKSGAFPHLHVQDLSREWRALVFVLLIATILSLIVWAAPDISLSTDY